MTILLQAPGGGMIQPLFLIGMVVVMYFFMIRPQAKKAKEQKKFSESIQAGEDIVTTSGIHGKINRVNEDGTLKVEVASNTYMTFERAAVSMELTTAARKKA
jgi:preprotein translocase subunit YajC